MIASFHQTQWTILPVATGSIKAKSISFVFSQEIIRFFHGQDECITIPETWADHPQHNFVVYEGGDALERARSLWRIELVKAKYAFSSKNTVLTRMPNSANFIISLFLLTEVQILQELTEIRVDFPCAQVSFHPFSK